MKKGGDISSLAALTGFCLNQVLREIEYMFKFKDLAPVPTGADFIILKD